MDDKIGETKVKRFYSGIGSRNVPDKVVEQIFRISVFLAERNYILRSGAADGCDAAFEVGCDSVSGEKEIYLPWKRFNGHSHGIDSPTLKTYLEARKLAEKYHPEWKHLSEAARKFHTRNVYQVLGESLCEPVSFVVCYTNDGKASGGTGQAMRIALDWGIPIYNLYYDDTYDKLANNI